MTDENEITVEELKPIKLAEAQAAFTSILNNQYSENPWSTSGVDLLESVDINKYKKVVQACRFFYRRDPIASSVVNKMIDIGITDLFYEKTDLSPNEQRIVEALLDEFKEFAEAMALEYLISGLIVPEIKFEAVTTDKLKLFGIKKYSSLQMPTAMWLRDPETIKINTSMILNKPSYYVKIPDKLVFFIQNRGTYPDGTKDTKLYEELIRLYPAFVSAIRKGETEILLENPYIIRRRVLADSPYPTPYLYSAIEPMKHKRNLRRMDYSIASRVISAIQLIKMGSDDFPVTEGDSTQFDDLRNQMMYRYTGGRDLERIFQLFANHTVSIEWIMPDLGALVDDTKYRDVNRDIFYALGFPNILITGEAERTGSSEAEYALLSPIKTMESFRKKILWVLNFIVDDVFDLNNLRGSTSLRFEPLNLHSFKYFLTALADLYNTGNLSRTSYARAFGYNLDDELVTRSEEQELLEELDLPEFSPQPFSPQPGSPGGGGQPNPQSQTKPKPKNNKTVE